MTEKKQVNFKGVDRKNFGIFESGLLKLEYIATDEITAFHDQCIN